MWFLNQKRADQVASSIAQFIHTLAVGREHDGPIGPERLLRGLAPLLGEDTIIGQRVVKLLIGLAGKAKFFSGFSLACALPPRTVMIDLRPSAVGHQARLLYAACKTMPNVVERRDFR